MGVDICGSTNSAVTKPCLNLFQRDTMREQKRSTAMAKIVKSELRHIVLLQNSRNMICKIAGSYQFPNFVHIDIVQILSAIAVTAQLPILLLLGFHLEQYFLKRCYQRKRSKAGRCFGTVCNDQFCFSVHCCFCDCVANGDGLSLKIDGIPF